MSDRWPRAPLAEPKRAIVAQIEQLGAQLKAVDEADAALAKLTALFDVPLLLASNLKRALGHLGPVRSAARRLCGCCDRGRCTAACGAGIGRTDDARGGRERRTAARKPQRSLPGDTRLFLIARLLMKDSHINRGIPREQVTLVPQGKSSPCHGYLDRFTTHLSIPTSRTISSPSISHHIELGSGGSQFT